MHVPGHLRASLLAVAVAVAVGGVAGCAHPVAPAAAGASSASASTAAAPAVSPVPSPPGTGAADLPACRAGQLTVRLIYGGAAAGTISGVIGFANHSRTACSLTGWPALLAVGPAGTVRGRRTLSLFAGPTLTAPPVVPIRPGAQAVAVLTGGDQPPPGSATCPPPLRRLLVAPPGSAHRTAIPAWIPGLGGYLPACVPVRISPVIPASALPFLPRRRS